jgi:hypothetical protein
MACQLYAANDLSALYSIVYKEIKSRIEDPGLGKFDNKALDKFIKEMNDEFKDLPDGILYVQAIPDMVETVSADPEIARYLLKESKLDFNYVKELSLDFGDLKELKKFLTPKKTVRTKKQIETTIKKSNKASKNIVQNNNHEGVEGLSELELSDKAKITFPNKLTGQIAIAKNPKTMTEAERNARDEDKKLFDEIIKTVIWASKDRNALDQVKFGDISLMLRAQPLSTIPREDLTNDDRTFLSNNKGYEINVAIISDSQGNPLRFDNEGNISETGRIVYQYIRPVIESNNELYLGNRSGYKYTLASAQEIAEAEIKETSIQSGELFGEDERNSKIAGIKQKQTQLMNDLARLNKRLQDSSEYVLLPITGGSYGIIEKTSELLSKTDFVDDLDMIFIHNSGTNKGYSYFIASRVKAGVAVNGKIYLQKMDMSDELADKVAKVLTTKSLLEGEALNPELRLKYYSNFLANTVKGNNIKVSIIEELGIKRLDVQITDPETKEVIDIDLNVEGAEKIISDHLKKVKVLPNGISYPASMSYMESFAVDGVIQKGVTFTDYEFITRNGKEVIKEVERDYFDFIKPLAKVDYPASTDSGYFYGMNTYLEFAVPEDLTTPADELVDIAVNTTDDLTNPNIDNSNGKQVARIPKEKASPLTVKKSTLANNKVLVANMNKADVVFGIGVNFDSTDDKFIKDRAGSEDKWFGIQINKKKKDFKNFKIPKEAIDQIVKNLKDIGGSALNIVGNDIGVLDKAGYSQEDINDYVYNILKEVNEVYPITKITSNGQTGIAEASVKAAQKLKIPVDILAFKDYSLKVYSPKSKTKSRTTTNSYSEFVKRFGITSNFYKKARAKNDSQETKKKYNIPLEFTDAEIVEEEPIVETQTKEQRKISDRRINTLSTDALLDGISTDVIPDALERSKRRSAVMNQLYGNKQNWDKVNAWFDKSPLKALVKVEREKLATVINSTAYGTFITAGHMLSDAGQKLRAEGFAAQIDLYGDALPITLYHEAWHAFSQLVLTIDEKTKLYDEIRTYEKWAGKEYIDIEEDLAEDFIEYVVNGTKQKGFIQKVFDRIKSIIDYLFGNTTKRDVTRLYEIPSVKALYDTLYTGNFTIDTLNAENNLMPGFQKLNSSKNLIQPLKNTAKDFAEITDVESNKIVDILDSLMARTFRQYNVKFNTTSGATRLLGDLNVRANLYKNLEKQLDALMNQQAKIYADIAAENVQSETPDYITEQKELDKLNLLIKATENFGDVDLALTKKSNKGVVPFHMKKSRFNVLKDEYIDETEDASTAIFKTSEGNSISAKQLATTDTLMTLSGIYKLRRDSKGNYIKETDEDGVETYQVDTDDFGLPILESQDAMWKRLSRTLQGSLDYEEISERLHKNISNYPEFIQVIEMLPDPNMLGPGAYNNKSEFETETNFWQDFKKPVVPYTQLNINKTVVEKSKKVNGKVIPAKFKYESRLAAANFDIYRIINDWTTNFNIADPATNKYIKRDKFGNNYLNTNKILKDFSENGQLLPFKANDFLAALGIQMDMTSAEIRSIVENTKQPFATKYNIEYIFENIKLVNAAGRSKDEGLRAAAQEFKKSPMQYLLNGLPIEIEKAAGGKSRDVRTKITTLAQLQNRFSDGYSNYSVLTPEKNKVWEQFLDNTITRVITSINLAKNWQELTDPASDPNGRFQHMRWLAENNNPSSQFSVLLNSVFDLNPLSPNYGEKRADGALLLENIGGTQIISTDTNESNGSSTASTDVTSKFLQEFHTMIQAGVQEFMRHASKQTAMNLKAKNLKTYPSKKSKSLYVDVMAFSPTNSAGDNNFGESQAFNILLGYIASEGGRIYRYKFNEKKFSQFTGYNRKVVRKDNGKIVDAGEAFTAFDDVLSPEVQGDLYALIDKTMEDALDTGYFNPEDFNLKDIINDSPELRSRIKNDVTTYFNLQTQQNYSRLQSAYFVDQSLYDLVSEEGLSKAQVDKMLVKAYTYNSWIHNFETTVLAYGDTVQYNHDKEEFHKRNAGLGSGGRGFRADFRARMYINSPMFKRLYAEKEGYKLDPFSGKLNTAIIREEEIKESVYKSEYYDAHVKDYTKRYLKAGKSKAEAERLAKKLADTVLKDYSNMKLADGQGWVNFEAYRMLKNLESSWSAQQEDLYKRVVNNELITADEIKEFFPPYKLQYYGNIQTSGLPLTSFHKFSLAPIIPTVHTADTRLGQIHDMMLAQNVDYVLMETGSKVGHIGSGDVIADKDGNIDTSVQFTKNVIFLEYLKNQTEVNSKYKGKSIFSTQLRKLVLEGLYEQGKIVSPNEEAITSKLVEKYVNRVSDYTTLLKNELIDEIGFVETADGEFQAKDKNSLGKLAKMIRDNLTRDDVYSDNLIDIIDVTEEGQLRFDLSLHPEASKIEKLLLSLINKRIIKQKVKGEPLVQKSSAFYEGLFELPLDLSKKTGKARDAAVKKYMGSNFLPTYHKGENGNTTAMKVAISLQGEYANLLNLEYKGEAIETIERLNEAIKDDSWLDENDGQNRKAITMVGVRIPVQGLNSMEFMEVYHFLPAEAGNIIIPPAEIVAKSGADFDIDKLSIFMNSIDPDGNLIKPLYENTEEFLEAVKDPESLNMTKGEMYAIQKAGIENELINDIREILELPQNFVSLTTPNGTYLVKPIADELSEYVMDYSPLQNMMTTNENGEIVPNLSAPDKNGKQRPVISPTRIFEVGYNLYKHESNVVGKRTLGLGAIENTFNVVFNSLGAAMPSTYTHYDEETIRISKLGLRHNTLTKSGEELISLSNQYDVDGVNKVADVISQLMNGWVDVEKDAWVFFVQGNYEVAPILLYLLKAGVPVREAIYFVSQPLVREYVKERRITESIYAEPLRRATQFQGVATKAASTVIAKYFDETLPSSEDLYLMGNDHFNNYFKSKNRKDDERYFTETEMLDLIKDFKEDPKEGRSSLSRAMFLHYLEIEKQIQGITALKMASNPDTSLMTDIGQAIQAESNLEALAIETKIDQDLRIGLLYDSVISSFFNNKLAKGLGKPLFKFRYDEDIQDYIQEYMADFKNSKVLKALFGRNYRDIFPVVFRNDILSYIFQNALRKYNLGSEYSSYATSESVPLKSAAGLKFGAFVETNKSTGKPTLYVDRGQIEKEFFDKAYLEGSDSQNSYEKRGLYPLKPGHFGSNTGSNKDEYIRFVLEREYLRSITPIEDILKTQEFQDEYFNATESNIKDSDIKNRRYAYEKILATKALDNVLNPYHLFKDSDNAYATRLYRIKEKYANDFVKDYPILSRVVVDSNKKKTMFNMFIDDKDMSTFKSNMYTRNLEDLSNRAIKKVEDKVENDRISDLFAKITYVAMMQSGTNKNKYNFLNLTSFNKFVDIMNSETAKFLTSPAKLRMLVDFKNKFEQVNSQTNRDKARFKNYLTSLDVQQIENLIPEKAESLEEASEGIANTSDNLLRRKNLLPTSNPDIFLYQDLSGTEKAYQYIVDNNPDVTFLYQLSLGQKQAMEKLSPEEWAKKKVKGQILLQRFANSSSVGIVTGQNSVSDSFSITKPENYKTRMEDIEKGIAEANQVLERGGKIALSINGYGDPALMPEELFVYLSKRLFQEFQYLNPGSEFIEDISKEVSKYQPTTDAEILAKFEGENSPLKC